MKTGYKFSLMIGSLAVLAPVAATASTPPERNAVIRPLLDCRKIADAPARLACFDRESASLDAADEKNEITVLDKDAVRKTRRSLFGFSLPRLPFFDGKDDDGQEEAGLQAIEATIASVRSLGYGKWQLELDDGARWSTTEAIVGRAPEAGKTIEIKRGAIGSYFGKIEGRRAVRMQRVN